MKRQNLAAANVKEFPGRITRARAASLDTSRQFPPLKACTQPPQQSQKPGLRANKKRAYVDENNENKGGNACIQNKRRAVLQDVTNAFCKPSYGDCFNATKVQAKKRKPAKRAQARVTKMTPSTDVDLKTEVVHETVKTELMPSMNLEDGDKLFRSATLSGDAIAIYQLEHQSSEVDSEAYCHSNKEIGNLLMNMITSSKLDVVDIDAGHKDPQLCSLYAPDIYNNLRVAELSRRPFPGFMETIQRDITTSMRGILVDWLVEVSEEYKLVPDTLYLTVYLIDWFLSKNYIERQRLQLLGITCMLIASKYEEICAPRLDEFCFMTDNTYTKEDVLQMENQVLKYLGFQLFAPTAKSFLRRFLLAAQASYKSPSLELECLANYLAELALVDYGFLKFLPSMIAASAVFLSKWTLDQSSHPWNPILEHYTSYKPSDLKISVLALQDLQLNTNGCPLSAVRMKYKQPKFKSVAALSSPKLLETLF
uniref:cyclin-A2-4 isoform X2 n=1 Tax=Fragaria vesca subsp. vesca TaxID=101020 RepID=UPI0005CB5B70|nr:PREDICTED: cyclin-A2-4 isoform X2 [Fragaria vesca subsp. vesca]